MGLYTEDFLYLHIPKTGGISHRDWLEKNFKARSCREDGFPIGHIRAADIKEVTGRDPRDFPKIIAVIRDPFDQQVSQWLHWLNRFQQGDRHVCCFGAACHDNMDGWLRDPYSDFDLWYLQHLGQEHEKGGLARWISPSPGYYHFWLQVEGRIPENLHLVWFENMAQEWAQAFQDDTPLPILNRGPKKEPLNTYLTDFSRMLIMKKFQWAFQHFSASQNQGG